ncbi:unnamed protein product [Leptidea sinapis]|uniref:GST N-terminal domain-containing protein n=1 Tax=Leptidea sinapis TaxID=189913 RepID=A0A5E4PU33_9NEOP|nr:unnamed protein product [Leptidea sinapis]
MVGETKAILYGFWLSSCSWRVRAALHLKRVPYVERNVDIVKERRSYNYLMIGLPRTIRWQHDRGINGYNSIS